MCSESPPGTQTGRLDAERVRQHRAVLALDRAPPSRRGCATRAKQHTSETAVLKLVELARLPCR
jgi:hypothetical protein